MEDSFARRDYGRDGSGDARHDRIEPRSSCPTTSPRRCRTSLPQQDVLCGVETRHSFFLEEDNITFANLRSEGDEIILPSAGVVAKVVTVVDRRGSRGEPEYEEDGVEGKLAEDEPGEDFELPDWACGEEEVDQDDEGDCCLWNSEQLDVSEGNLDGNLVMRLRRGRRLLAHTTARLKLSLLGGLQSMASKLAAAAAAVRRSRSQQSLFRSRNERVWTCLSSFTAQLCRSCHVKGHALQDVASQRKIREHNQV